MPAPKQTTPTTHIMTGDDALKQITPLNRNNASSAVSHPYTAAKRRPIYLLVHIIPNHSRKIKTYTPKFPKLYHSQRPRSRAKTPTRPKNQKQNKTDNTGQYESIKGQYCPTITQRNPYCPKRGLFVQQRPSRESKQETFFFTENTAQTKRPASNKAGLFISSCILERIYGHSTIAVKPLTASSNGLSRTQ